MSKSASTAIVFLPNFAKAKVKLSEQEIMDQTMDFFRSQPEYKALKEKGLKGTSTDQNPPHTMVYENS